jgi:RHS repeat-associated protein
VQCYANEIRYSNDGNGNILGTVTIKNWFGKLLPPESHTLTYDPFDRLETETSPLGHTLAYSHDDGGARSTLAFAGSEIRYEYNERGLLQKVASPLNEVTYAYYPDDRLRSIKFPENYSTSFERLPNGWIQKVRHLSPSGAPFLEYSYKLNNVGDAVRIDVVSEDLQATHAFTYDHLHRLETETYSGGLVIKHEYDKAGRRSRQSAGGVPYRQYGYDEFGRLISVTDSQGRTVIQLDYDRTGKVTERWQIGILIRLGYNPWQQLVLAHWAKAPALHVPLSNPASVTIDYDYRGRRLKRYASISAMSEGYLYDDDKRVAELAWAPGYPVSRRYIFGQKLLGVVQTDRRWLAMSDRIGSVTRLQGLGDAPTSTQEFTAWGELLSLSAPAYTPPLGFAGGWLEPIGIDSSAPLLTQPIFVQLGERTYDPAITRFWSPDPLEVTDPLLASEDPYVYANNRPTLLVDPTGRQAESFEDLPDLEGPEKAGEFDAFEKQYLDTEETPSDKARDKDLDRILNEMDSERSGRASSARDGNPLIITLPAQTSESVDRVGSMMRPTTRGSYDESSVYLKRESTVFSSRGIDENAVASGAGVTDPATNVSRAINMLGQGLLEVAVSIFLPEVFFLGNLTRLVTLGHGLGMLNMGTMQYVTAPLRTPREDRDLTRANTRASVMLMSPATMAAAASAAATGNDPAKAALYTAEAEAALGIGTALYKTAGGLKAFARPFAEGRGIKVPGVVTQLRRLVYDTRKFDTISKQFWKGKAEGWSLEHLFVTQKMARDYPRLLGVANSYINSRLEIPGLLNSYTGNYRTMLWAERGLVIEGSRRAYNMGRDDANENLPYDSEQ